MITKTVLQLIEEDIITLEQFHKIVSKNANTKRRARKKQRDNIVKQKVEESLMTLLEKPGSAVKHRTVWNTLGQDDYTRDEVLNALRSLRNDGILQNIKTSNNNFQVFWAYVKQPTPSVFGTVNEIEGNCE